MEQEREEELLSAEETPGVATIISPPEKLTVDEQSYSVLRFRDFRLLLISAFLTMFGSQIITVAIGWELYARTHSALVLGGVGLAQIIPIVVLFLPAGYIIDRYSRKHVLIAAQVLQVISSLGLAILSLQQGSLVLIYACLMGLGAAQAFSGPASSAIVGQVIPVDAYEKAMTWRSSVSQLSAVLGPASGGFLIGLFHGSTVVYIVSAVSAAIIIVLLVLMRVHTVQGQPVGRRSLRSLMGGLRFLGQTQVMLAAITLDLFAVLLGGAVTLLPIYATSILHVGPIGLGWLQAASSMGAVAMALWQAHLPPYKKAGRVLLLAVIGFGIATIVFGLSRSFWLSLAMLFLTGAFDNVSVVIRSTLALVRTPDEMRGRVSAVTSLFIGTSNQLGGFESGLAAQFLGPVAAVVYGGIGTILVVLIIAGVWPEMRRLGTLREEEAAALE